MDDDLERSQLREACLQAMPRPGESAPRVSLFQWAREASPPRVLRLLNTIEQLLRQRSEEAVTKLERERIEAEREDDATLRLAIEAEWDTCRGVAAGLYWAVKDLPGVWSPKIREAMRRAEVAGLHRFDEGGPL